MHADVRDLRSTIIPKSDQLNSDQLLGGPMIITVSDVRVGGGDDQPVSVYYALDPQRPFKPCKTMRKLLIHAWGSDGTQWIGKSLELFNEPSIKFGGETVGGIRISRMSGINPKGIEVSLAQTRGRKTLHRVMPLKASAELTAALEAIEAATGKESLKKARALAEALQSPADLESAVAAYKRRVDSLKAAAAPKAEEAPAKTLHDFVAQIDTATSAETASFVIDEARDVLDAAGLAELQAAFDMAWKS
jgi:hypothetical protein